MSIYKASNLQPHLQEIDIEKDNTFTCSVNTSGTPVYAYKMDILSIDGETKIYDGAAVPLTHPIENKDILEIPHVSNQTEGMESLTNGKDYQWGVRTYEAPLNSNKQPQTLICSGYLVGSTRYVIWTNNNEKLTENRWIQFTTIGTSQLMPVPIPNSSDMVLPQPAEVVTERRQITWVDKELGWNKDITKLELEDEFTYNYIDGTPFDIYQCSDKHTEKSIFVDANDLIQLGYYIVLFDTWAHANAAAQGGYLPDSSTTPQGLIATSRKIVGYSDDTGEIRVQQPFGFVPTNGMAYLMFEKSIIQTEAPWKLVSSNVSQVVGGAPITSDDFKVITNVWNSTKKQLFIQPNINIKTDLTNPNEIVFDNDGVRLDIIQEISSTVVPRKKTDITFNKLDNTQWMLTYFSDADQSKNVVVTPKTYYKVYSDFMDSSPNGVFYCRETPEITMKFRDDSTESGSNYIAINESKRLKIQPNSFIPKNVKDLTDESYYIQVYNRKEEYLKIQGSTTETKNKIVDYDLENGVIYLQNEFQFTNTFKEIDTTCKFKLYKEVDGTQEEIEFVGLINAFSEVTLDSQTGIYTIKTMKNTLINENDIIKIYKDSLIIGKRVTVLSVDHSDQEYSYFTFDASDITHTEIVEPRDTYELFESDGIHQKYFNQLSNYFQTFWGWRDIQFKAEWESENNTLIKYYQYSLYDSDGLLIGQSDEIYDTQLTWNFKGFDSGKTNGAIPPILPIIFPSEYTISLKIVDVYDTVFTQDQKFGVYYQVERGLIPLEVEEICKEHSIRVAPTVPSKVVSTSILDEHGEVEMYTATSTDVVDDAIKIPLDRCLNYTTIAGSENNIDLPTDFSLYAEFKLGDNENLFLPQANDDGGEITILKFVHNIVKLNQYLEEEIYPEELEVRIGSANKFQRTLASDGESYVYKENPNYLKIRVYNLDSETPNVPLYCFENGTEDYYSLLDNDEMQEFVDITRALYALQEAASPDDKYQIVDKIPFAGAKEGKYYIPRITNVDNNIYYYADYIYLYNGAYYILQNQDEYIYIENTNQFEGSTYESLQVPERLREPDAEDGQIYWTKNGQEETEGLNKWIDSGYISLNNRRVLSKKWFKLYLTGKTENEVETIRCNIKISNERG